MKVKVIQGYYLKYADRNFHEGDIIKVEEVPNSDFFHIWEGNNLLVIPKENCKAI